jgi:hypothetical protein
LFANFPNVTSAGQDCRASLPGKPAGQVCRASLPGKPAGQDEIGCRLKSLQYAGELRPVKSLQIAAGYSRLKRLQISRPTRRPVNKTFLKTKTNLSPDIFL